MEGRARAPAAGTVLNALATGTGSAFAIDLATTAAVELSRTDEVTGAIDADPDADTALIERCVSLALERFGDGELTGGHVRTESDVPIAAGLKSSSAAANAAVMATVDALGEADTVAPLTACRLGVQAARQTGVTVTGAFDDASASMLGGVTVTDNESDEVLVHEPFERAVAVYTPERQAFSADADVDRCRRIAVVANAVADLAKRGRYEEAMTINGFSYSAALGFSPDPMLDALASVDGVSLSGTGPSTVAVGRRPDIVAVASRWRDRPGAVRVTGTNQTGAQVG